MISSFRKFSKSKIAAVFVGIIILPFVFWGMGSTFSSGNSNNVVKINNTHISTQEFIDHINKSNIPERTIRENLDKNIIEELLSTLISTRLLDLEIKDFDIIVSEEALIKKIKTNKNFLNDEKKFERIKYEKFLLENNQSAPAFELRLRGRELQKKLFDYIGAGTTTPKFLAQKLFSQENSKLQIQYLNLKSFYKNKEEFTDVEIQKFLDENKDQLKIEYIDFNYAIINPKSLIGVDEFNQAFFDKIDEIEVNISNNINFKTIVNDLNIDSVTVTDFRYSKNQNDIEKRIFESRNIEFDIIENENNFILYKINQINKRSPNINDLDLKNEVLDLVLQKNKYDYNSELLKKINNKEIDDDEFKKMGKENINTLILNSIKDNNKFDINAVELLYSLPENSFTLINDENGNIYLAKIENIQNQDIDVNNDKFNEYMVKQNTNNKNTI